MAKLGYQAEIPLTETDSDLNWLQFMANHEMQSLLLPDNLFGNGFDECSFTALLGLTAGVAGNLLQQTSIVSQTCADEDMNIEADWQKQKDCGTTNQSKGNLGGWPGIGPSVAASRLATFPSDAALVERAVKYSSFANGNNSSHVMKPPIAMAEESAPSTATSGNSKGGPSRFDSAKDLKLSAKKKRKNAQSSKTVDSEAALKGKRCKGADSTKETIEDSEGKAEQSKMNNDECANSAVQKSDEDKNAKALTLPEKSNYIHVRARRGQATDSHSLAERVRREKISERMKLLQDLVPGCSRITGKALMLDEIINHVQSLQRQVEFLSMKLATVNRRFDFDTDSGFAKEMMTSSMPEPSGAGISPPLTASPYLQYQQPEPTSSMLAVAARTSMDLASAWNVPFHNAYTPGFHPTRVQPPLEPQAIPGMFALNHMMKREI